MSTRRGSESKIVVCVCCLILAGWGVSSAGDIGLTKNGDMEDGFFNTNHNSACSGRTSQLPVPVYAPNTIGVWGWNMGFGGGNQPTSTSQANVFQENSIVRSGSRSLGFRVCTTANSPGMNMIAAQNHNVGAHATFTITVWAYYTNGNTVPIIAWNPGMEQFDPIVANIAGRYRFVPTGDTFAHTNQWITATLVGQADASGIVSVIIGAAGFPGGANQYVYFDDVGVTSGGATPTPTPTAGANLVVNGNMDGGFTATGHPSSCSGFTSALPSPIIVPGQPGTWGWNVGAGGGNQPSNVTQANCWQETNVVRSAPRSLGFRVCTTANSPGMNIIASQLIEVGANASFTFRAWAYYTNGNTIPIMAWNPGDDNNPLTALAWGRYISIPGTQNFQLVNQWIEGVISSQADGSGRITIMVGAAGYPGGANAYAYFDDLSVVVSAAATSTPTDTPVPPTNTPTNTVPAATNTPTNTVAPATSTPTNTVAGPTNTPTNTVPSNDLDGDGIPDALEANPPASGQTNSLLPDSDGDGLDDGTEDANRNGQRDPGETDARNRDTDGDQIIDGVEVLFFNSNPLNAASPGPQSDADNDALPQPHDPNDGDPDIDDDRFADGYEAVMLGLGAVTSATLRPPLGDLNRDNAVSNFDSLLVQSLFVGNALPNNPIFQGTGFRNSDVNRDGFISNLDALIIQVFFVGTLPTLPM